MRFLELHNQLNEASKEYNYIKFFSDKIGKFLEYFQRNVDKYSKNKNADGSYSFPISEIVKEVNDEKSILSSMRKGTIQFVRWKKAYNMDPIIHLASKSTGKDLFVRGAYLGRIDNIMIPYLDFKEEDLKYGYPWVDKIKSTLLHELTHKFQKVSGNEFVSTINLSREDWLKDKHEKEAILNQMYEEIQAYIKNLFRILDSSKKEYFKTKDEEYKWEYIDTSNDLYRIFKSEESFEKEFYENHRYKESLRRAEELNKIDKSIMKDFLSDSYHELRKEFENVYPEKKISSKDGKLVIEESEERSHGKLMSELKPLIKNVMIFRARDNKSDTFEPKDYVTLSSKFALEHAESNHVYSEEPHIVIRAVVPTKHLAEASNPGEWFYIGPTVHGDVVYKSLGPDEYEGKIVDLRFSRKLKL